MLIIFPVGTVILTLLDWGYWSLIMEPDLNRFKVLGLICKIYVLYVGKYNPMMSKINCVRRQCFKQIFQENAVNA